MESKNTSEADEQRCVCEKCGKNISDDEYCVNWGWCEECLNKDYAEYLKRERSNGRHKQQCRDA